MISLRFSNSPLRGVRILKVGPGVIQTATLTGRRTRGGPLTLPKPYPYKEKKYRWYNNLFDNTMVKVCQENAKIIAVEGPIGVGKSAFCKALAEEFDMLFIPQPTMDEYYILPSGYDLRQHDHEVAERVRTYDHKNFCQSPKDVRAGWFQINMLYLRFCQYVDAVCHILNTGQGVVLERSYYSDYVFVKAMLENNYISKGVADCHTQLSYQSSNVLMQPHLVIYLDISEPVVQERIRTRNFCYEQNAPALTKEYILSLEKYWKQDYLRKARETSEILIYDWTDGGDIDVVIDDIEKINFDIMRGDQKFVNWWIPRGELYKLRYMVTNCKEFYVKFFEYPYYRIDDLYIPIEYYMQWNNIFRKLPECKYEMGYNYLMGDSILKILLQNKVYDHRHHRNHLVYESWP